MSHISPAVYLVWALLSIILGAFLVFHLWSFDRFRCLRWDHGPYAGAFKRVMTYTYLLSIPAITLYSVGFAIIKYLYGFTVVPEIGIMPTPHTLWSATAQHAIFPLYLSLSISWALEMVTHLEELCFWLFLVNAGSEHQDWFQSVYFKLWTAGSCIAVVAMPLITVLTRTDVFKCEGYTFLTGGLASLSLTIWFLPILWTLPAFIEHLKTHDVEKTTLVRLTKYHELNCIRVIFRFLFTIPLVILGVDGVRPHQHINDKMFPTDLLSILAAIGCVVSSGITLVIFFPRSTEIEMTQKEQQRTRRHQRARRRTYTVQTENDSQSCIGITHQSKSELDHYDPFMHSNSNGSFSTTGLPMYDSVHPPVLSVKVPLGDHDGVFLPTLKAGGSVSLQPNRRTAAGDVELGAVLTDSEVDLVRARSKRGGRSVSSLVHHWRSPIEIGRPVALRWRQGQV